MAFNLIVKIVFYWIPTKQKSNYLMFFCICLNNLLELFFYSWTDNSYWISVILLSFGQQQIYRPMVWARAAYMCNVITPILHVISALNASNVHNPLMAIFKTASNHKTLNGVAISNNVTIGLYLLFRSWRVNSQINVAVVKCWIWKKLII